jgi:hypothetical protein
MRLIFIFGPELFEKKIGQLVTLIKICPIYIFYAKRPFQNAQELVFRSRMSKVMKV